MVLSILLSISYRKTQMKMFYRLKTKLIYLYNISFDVLRQFKVSIN